MRSGRVAVAGLVGAIAMAAAWSARADPNEKGTVDPGALKRYEPHAPSPRFPEPPAPGPYAPPSRTVHYKVKEVDGLALSGLSLAQAFAHTGARTSPIYDTAEAVIVLGNAVDAATDARTDSLENRLVTISNRKQVLESLKKHGRLTRGDPLYDAVTYDLYRDLDTGPFKGRFHGPYSSATAFFLRAILSPEGLLAEGEVIESHYVPAFFGKWIAEWLEVGPRLREWGLSDLVVQRDTTRPVWKRADQLARVLSKMTDKIGEKAVKVAVEPAVHWAVDEERSKVLVDDHAGSDSNCTTFNSIIFVQGQGSMPGRVEMGPSRTVCSAPRRSAAANAPATAPATADAPAAAAASALPDEVPAIAAQPLVAFPSGVDPSDEDLSRPDNPAQGQTRATASPATRTWRPSPPPSSSDAYAEQDRRTKESGESTRRIIEKENAATEARKAAEAKRAEEASKKDRHPNVPLPDPAKTSFDGNNVDTKGTTHP
jgi:hypothetical protein